MVQQVGSDHIYSQYIQLVKWLISHHLFNGLNQTNNTKVVSIYLCACHYNCSFQWSLDDDMPWFSGMCFYIIVPACNSLQHQRKIYKQCLYNKMYHSSSLVSKYQCILVVNNHLGQTETGLVKFSLEVHGLIWRGECARHIQVEPSGKHWSCFSMIHRWYLYLFRKRCMDY